MCQADRYRTIQVKRYTLIFPAPHYTPDPYSTRAPYSSRTPQSTPASSSTPAPLSTLTLTDSSEPLTIPCFFNLLLSLLLLLPSPSPHPTSSLHSTMSTLILLFPLNLFSPLTLHRNPHFTLALLSSLILLRSPTLPLPLTLP